MGRRSRRRLQRAAGGLAAAVLLAGAAFAPARAETSNQVWPELDAFFSITETTRLFLMARGTRMEQVQGQPGSMGRDSYQVGAHLDVTLAPIFRPELAKGDWQRQRYLWMRVGYRYSANFEDEGGVTAFEENRGIFEVTARTKPLAGGFEYVGRFRWDARDVNDEYSNRYRLRLQVEKVLKLDGRPWVPFVNAEAFYDTRYDAWTRERYQLGVEIELDPRWRIEPSYFRQNDERTEPARVYALGLVLKYFY